MNHLKISGFIVLTLAALGFSGAARGDELDPVADADQIEENREIAESLHPDAGDERLDWAAANPAKAAMAHNVAETYGTGEGQIKKAAENPHRAGAAHNFQIAHPNAAARHPRFLRGVYRHRK